MNDSSLLSASLNRFKSIDEAHVLSSRSTTCSRSKKHQERSYDALQARLQALQKQVDAREMGSSSADAQEECGLGDMVELEVSVVREKLQGEVLKYKSRVEELERVVSHADVLEMWSKDKENDFRDTINSRVMEVERAVERLIVNLWP